MNKYNSKKNYNRILWLLPLILVVAIVPTVVRMNPTPLSSIEQFILGKEITNDFFSKSKSQLVMFCGLLATVLILVRYLIVEKYTDIKKSMLYVPIGIYTVLVILSTVAGKYYNLFLENFPQTLAGQTIRNSIPVWGFWDRYEGAFVLFSYMILLVFAINIINNEFDIKVVINSAIFGACYIGIIGIFQFFGMDFFRSDLGKAMMIPYKYIAVREHVSFNFGKGTIYSTLYNTNYVGTYMAIFLPIVTSIFLFEKDKNRKIIFGVISWLVFANLIGSNSSTGMIATLAALPFFVFLLRKPLMKNWKKIAVIGGVCVITFVIMDISSNHKITNELGFNFEKDNNTTVESVKPMNDGENISDIILEDNDFKIIGEKSTLRVGRNTGKHFVLSDESNIVLPYINVFRNMFQISYNNTVLSLVYNEGSITLLDTENEVMDYEQTDNVLKLVKEGYEDFEVVLEQGGQIINVIIADNTVSFDFTTDNDLNIYHNGFELFELDQFSSEGIVIANLDKYSPTGENIKVLDERYYHYLLSFNQERTNVIATVGSKKLNIAYTDQGVVVVSVGGYVIRDMTPAESGLFSDNEGFASNRGYIWSRSFPILKDTLIVGAGPDTFALAFPQNEIIAKTNNFLASQILVDKPHNMYLQIGINTGVVSLVALLVLFAVYGLWTLSLYWKKDIKTYADYIAVGIFVAVVGYLVSGIGNDSIVSIAPVFWVLLGVGISINYKTMMENKKIKEA